MKLLFALCLLSACTALAADGKLQVAVANYPLKYFAERIGGSHVAVIFPAPADEDPAFWKPADADVLRYQQADLILMNGATYSKWAEKATLPRAKTIDTASGFKDKFIVTTGATMHSHGPGGEHSHSGTAFTTWIDLSQAISQADAVRIALSKKLPDVAAELEKNFAALKTDIAALDKRLLAAGKSLAKQPLVASHPVYQYFARRYELNLKDVLWEPEEVPTEAQMAELKKLLSSHPAKWMIWEGEPAKASVEKIKALGLQSTVIDPCGNMPETGDWLSVMQANVASIEAISSR